MSQKYLGETVDIHGGGIENQFPHHENEIAQAEAVTGKPFVKYWLHNNLVTVNGQKMGKSLGNFITLREAFEKWDPMVLRLFLLQSHYRSQTDFSEEALEAAQEGYRRLAGTAAAVSKALLAAPAGDADAAAAAMVADVRRRFAEAMDNDFGTAGAVAVLFDLAGGINTTISLGHATRGTLDCLKSTFEELSEGILGLKLRVSIPHPLESYSAGEGGQALERMFIRLVREWINLREDARKAKNFAQADAIRERLEEIGIALEDSPTGPTWRFTFKRQKPERRV